MSETSTGPHFGEKKDHRLQMNKKIEIIICKTKTAFKLFKGKSCFNPNVDTYICFDMKSLFFHLIATESSYGENDSIFLKSKKMS